MARKVTSIDDDAPEITAELLSRMRPTKEVTPGMVAAVKAARSRRRPKVDQPTVNDRQRTANRKKKN
jgi:hypothetical protein